jgi:signal transduction histidine kinase
VLTDLNSSNGTFINKIRIEQSLLEHNDKVFFGSRGFIFLLEPAVAVETDTNRTASFDDIVTITEAEFELSEMIENSVHVAVNNFLAPPLSGKKLAEHSILAYQRLSHLYQLSEILRSAKDTDTILTRGIGLVLQALPSAACAIVTTRTEDTQAFEVNVARFCNRNSDQRRLSISRKVLDRVVREQVALSGCSVSKDPDAYGATPDVIQPKTPFICVPLFSGDNAIGVLHVVAKDHAAPFTEHDMEFAAAVANEMALSIENCRLHHETTPPAKETAPLIEDVPLQQETAGPAAEIDPPIENDPLQRETPPPAGEIAGAAVVTNLSRYFENLLNNHKNAVDLLDHHLRNTDATELQANWLTLYEGLESLANFTADLLEYTGSEPVASSPLDVNATITSSCDIFEESLAAEGIALELDLKPDLPLWPLNESLLRSALIHLIGNAKDALTQTKDARITISTRMDEHQGLIIRVADNGKGLDPETETRLFELFYTTKDVKSSGLGLPLIKKFAERWGGDFYGESQPGSGATFSLVFPKFSGDPR